MSETPSTPIPTPAATPAILPPENLLRGTLLALLIIPAGIIVWVIVWAIGFVAAIVGIGIAVGALALYRRGSGGRVSYNGATRVSVIIVVTLILAFIAGLVSDNPQYFSRAAQTGKFFEGLAAQFARGGGDYLINLLLVAVFAVLGIVIVFRTAYTQAKADRAAGATPTAGTLPPQA
jgi:hypothetical protein